MAERDPIGRDLGRARAQRRLPPDAACVLCGERDPEVLRQRQSVLEMHHVAGRQNDDDLTVVLCLNCHRRATAEQFGHGVQLTRVEHAPTPERLIAVMQGLAAFFAQLAAQLQTWAMWLTAVFRDFDQRDPRWRDRHGRLP